MAFFGIPTGGGLSGLGNNEQPAFRPIIGIDNLLSANFNAQLLSAAVASSNNASPAFTIDESTAEIETPFDGEDTRSLDARVREVRALDEFVDLRDPRLDSVSDNPDRTATFATFIALDRLRTLAEFAADEGTPDVTLARLDEQFQQGLSEVRDFINAAELDRLGLFVGDREFEATSDARLGSATNRDFTGGLVTSDPDAALEGLTGTETFTVSIATRSAATGEVLSSNDFTIDLSNVSGTLSLNNIVDLVNNEIEALQQLDGNGDPVFDSDGNPVSDNISRFSVTNEGGQFGIQIDGSLLEDVSLSSAQSEPGLFVSSTLSNTFEGGATVSEVTEFSGLSGTLSEVNSFTVAATDVGASEIAEETAEIETEEDAVDPRIAELRDQFRADAVVDVLGEEEEEETDEILSRLSGVALENIVSAETQATRVAVDSEGNIFAIGTSSGSFGNQINAASEDDVFLTRLDQQGNVVFSRLLGSSGDADAFSIAIDANDNIVVTGQTDNALVDGDIFDNPSFGPGGDAFVASFTNEGTENFRFQLDTFAETSGLAVSFDANGDVLLGGFARSSIDGNAFGGGRDALLLRLDGASGSILDSNLIGGATNEEVSAISLASNGDIIVALEENGDAVLRRFDPTDLTNEVSSTNLGSLGPSGAITGISVDGNTVAVSGTTTGAGLNAGTVVGDSTGGVNGFVVGLTDTGTNLNANFTTFLSTTGADSVADVTVANGSIFVAGTTSSTFAGETSIGDDDGFVARINGTTGAIEDLEQFGTPGGADTNVTGVAFTQQGTSVLDTLGLTPGTVNTAQTRDIVTQTSARDGDFFFIEVDGRPRQRVEVQAGDTFNDLARQIRIGNFRDLEVSTVGGSAGEGLRISTIRGGPEVTLVAGTGDQEALARLGIPEGRLLPQDELFGTGEDEEDIPPEEDLGGTFGLGIDGSLNLRDRLTAQFVLSQLDNAISEIQRADRSLVFDPIRALLEGGSLGGTPSGPVSPATQNRLANLQDGLLGLQIGSGGINLIA